MLATAALFQGLGTATQITPSADMGSNPIITFKKIKIKILKVKSFQVRVLGIGFKNSEFFHVRQVE